MTDPPDLNGDELVADVHLGCSDEDDRRALEERVSGDPRLAARSEALGRILRPLDRWTVPPAPVDMADRVIRYARQRNEKMHGTAARERGRGGGLASRFRLSDLVGVAACVLVLFGIVVPGLSKLREHAQRTVCAEHFGIVYHGLASYAQVYGGHLPFAGSVEGASWLYSGPDGAPHASNSRHPYLLAKLGFVGDPSAFTCPSSAVAPVPVDRLADADDFAGSGNCSYDTLNMSGVVPSMADGGAAVYMSDSNPLFVNGFFDEGVNPNATNSPSHGGTGQNVLNLDGRVRWTTTPFRDRRDNIWLTVDRHAYTGTEAQKDKNDAFLVPPTPKRTLSARAAARDAVP